MIRFQAFGVSFKLPLLTLLTPLLASRLGLRGSIGAVMLALWAHESAHILAARLAGVRITELEIMPFGGSARMENPYQLPADRIIPVAAAGPAANLLAALTLGFMAHWGWIAAVHARNLMRPNLLLLLFNLLPALPLDGGRILYALLERPLGEGTALRIGLNLGRLLALALIGCTIAGGIRHGCWNLTLILSAVFIIASERDERRAHLATRAARLEEQLHACTAPKPVRIYQLAESAPLQAALDLLRPRASTYFVLQRGAKPVRLQSGSAVVEFLLKNNAPEATLGELPNGLSLCASSNANQPCESINHPAKLHQYV